MGVSPRTRRHCVFSVRLGAAPEALWRSAAPGALGAGCARSAPAAAGRGRRRLQGGAVSRATAEGKCAGTDVTNEAAVPRLGIYISL